MWSAAEFIGFSLILLRGIPALNILVIALQNPIILVGTVFVYIGIMRFFERKINFKFIYSILISYFLFHLFFLFVINDITIRTLVFDIYIAGIAFLTAYSLYKYKNATLSTTANFNTILFVVQGLVFTIRTVMIATGSDVTEVYSTSIFNLIQYFDALLIGLLWTFGFIIMLNQKLNSHISETKSHFEQIFNTSPDAVSITRMSDGMLIDCNEGYSRISGYSKDEVIGKTTVETNIWYNLDDRTEVVKEILKKGYLENRELFFRRKSGDLFTGLISGKIIQLKGVPHIISVTRDISERKRTEEALRESKEKFQQLADLLPQIVFESDINGRLTYVNKQAYKLLGYSEEDNMIGFNTLDLYPPEDKIRAIENIQKSVSGQKSTDNNEYTMIRKDGTTFKGLVYSNPIIKDGKPQGLRGIIVDITKNKESEEAMKLQNEELQKLNAEKDKFFSIISHDLKSPFNSIVGFSDLLVEQAREKNFDGIEQFADIILQSSHRAMDLLTNLMEWSRSQTGRMTFNPEYFELVNLINEVMLLLNHTAAQKSISITKFLPRNAPVYADKEMISTVLRNLISNAIKFTVAGGNIQIKIAQKPNELLVSINDTGVGISKEQQDELFKINQNHSTPGTNNEQGTGLGLILCNDFVEKHGGKLWAESEEGQGSTFYFTLPQLKV
jgi:PAS domain S-box-containing protein